MGIVNVKIPHQICSHEKLTAEDVIYNFVNIFRAYSFLASFSKHDLSISL